MILEVSVTQKHIDEGDQGHCGSCPIALALRDLGYMHSDIQVWHGSVRKDLSQKMLSFELPENAQDFICWFDSNSIISQAKAKPFTFTIDLQEAA